MAIIRLNDDDKRKIFERGLKQVYRDTTPIEPISYTRWLKSETSNEWLVTESASSGLGVMPEMTVGSPFESDQIYIGSNKTFEMRTFGLALIIQEAVIHYDMYKVVPPTIQALRRSCDTRYELVAYALLNEAFNASASGAYLDYRGDPLCKVDHSRLDPGGTWKNRIDADPGLGMLGLEEAWKILQKTLNERGLFTPITAQQIIVGTKNAWQVDKLLRSDYNPDNANMQFNPAKGMKLEKLVTPYLTQEASWFIAGSKESYRIKMVTGRSPDLQTSTDPRTRNLIATSRAEFRLEFFDGRGLVGSQGLGA